MIRRRKFCFLKKISNQKKSGKSKVTQNYYARSTLFDIWPPQRESHAFSEKLFLWDILPKKEENLNFAIAKLDTRMLLRAVFNQKKEIHQRQAAVVCPCFYFWLNIEFQKKERNRSKTDNSCCPSLFKDDWRRLRSTGDERDKKQSGARVVPGAQIYKHTNKQTSTNTQIQTHKYTYTNTNKQAEMRKYKHTSTHAQLQTHN